MPRCSAMGLAQTLLLVVLFGTVHHIAASIAPNTSLATLPVAYFGGNAKARPEANIEMLAKMRFVMIEKWEGPCWNECLANVSAQKPCEASCHVEHDMVGTLQRVKQLNPKVSTVFYWNTLLAFPFFAQVGDFAHADALLIDANTQKPVVLRNDQGMPDIFVYDYTKKKGRELWLDLVRNLTATGIVDGIFGDKHQVFAKLNSTGGGGRICNKWCGGISAEQVEAWNEGKNATMAEALRIIGDGIFFHYNTENGAKKSSDVLVRAANVRSQLQKFKYIWVGTDQHTDHDPADTTGSADNEDKLAEFLLLVEEGVFYGANGWEEYMGYPLGDPLGPAVRDQHRGIVTRNFTSGTSVEWHEKKGKGRVHWAHHPVPLTPTLV